LVCFYYPRIKIRKNNVAGHVALTGKKRNACGILVGKPEGKRAPGIPRPQWNYCIKLDNKE
jgi:hypothetical protein